MCCVAQIMKNKESWIGFDASIFFKVQRQIGQSPYVCEGMIGAKMVSDTRAECLNRWATLHDPDGRLRAAYAQACWNDRGPHQRIVLLG